MLIGLAVCVFAYLLGSVSFAYLAGKALKGIDIRKIGGGNAGALNVMREIGLGAGVGVLLADIAKGALPVLVAKLAALDSIWVMAAGFAAVVGHNWPVFFNFRGGKGAATTGGVMLAYLPEESGICIAPLVITVILTNNVRAGFAVGLACLPILAWLFHEPVTSIVYVIFLGLFLLVLVILDLRKHTPETKDLIVDRSGPFWRRHRPPPQ